MANHEEKEITPYSLEGAFVLALGVGLVFLDGRAPKAARWGIGLLSLYVMVRSFRK